MDEKRQKKENKEPFCEMCGHQVAILQKAHILAEGNKRDPNLLRLCPTCHMMFDTHLKPKIFEALKEYGIKGFPKSWEKSIYMQAAEASTKIRRKKEY